MFFFSLYTVTLTCSSTEPKAPNQPNSTISSSTSLSAHIFKCLTHCIYKFFHIGSWEIKKSLLLSYWRLIFCNGKSILEMASFLRCFVKRKWSHFISVEFFKTAVNYMLKGILISTLSLCNLALIGGAVGWAWERHRVQADGWVGGRCREYSMNYLLLVIFKNDLLYAWKLSILNYVELARWDKFSLTIF